MPGRTAAWHPPFSGAFLIICLFFPVIPVELFHGVDLHHRFILHVFIGRPHNFHHAEQGAACDPQTPPLWPAAPAILSRSLHPGQYST